ncbi:Imm26 family immunity protein [Pseudomonas sp. UC 17F4]|uniref:Imm26 family immunity protein n=1 Tax=Pseudomonas sp. UC 17F4 TaxID=1855328 RepID=UPI000B86C873|nr:Imm26 family immunity protein [Pseudomonas sp. UC 17F4]
MNKVKPGDIFAVPLDNRKQHYSYIRMYNDPNIAILNVTSKNRLLSITELENYTPYMDAFSLRTAVEKGEWPYIGNIPFNKNENPWPAPKKQVSTIRPDLKLVIYQGKLIPSEKFGEYDSLPEFKKFTDETLIKEIIANSEHFHKL